MAETWLHSNRRILLLALAPAILLGGAALAALSLSSELRPVVEIFAWICLAIALILLIGLVTQIFRPRIAYDQGYVLFYLQAGSPIRVPIQVVEAFFLGQGPANLSVSSNQNMESVNLIARLSQREPDWQRRDVKPALGRWCDGYVTIRGMWCEPLNGEVIRRLNRRLGEVSRAEQDAKGNDGA